MPARAETEMDRLSREPSVLRIGRYELHSEIAAGGMATVHLGRLVGSVGFSRTVAIKRLHPKFARERDFVGMFVDEARLAARIRHPNVVPIIDVVSTEEELFLVMDFIHGVSLSRLLHLARKQNAPPHVSVTLGIMAGVLHGLHAAHEVKDDNGEPLNIVHRDVSPQNVVVGSDGVARVLDFGIAKARGRLQNTMEGHIKGKLAYMAPEQMGGLDVGREADLYAAGVVMWEMLTGRRLFRATTEVQMFSQVLRGATESPKQIVPEVPQQISDLVMRALALDPADRFRTARDLARAIEETGPVASAGQIGAWVESLADTTLGHLTEVLAVVESGSSKRRGLASLPSILRERAADGHTAEDIAPSSATPAALSQTCGPTLESPIVSKRASAQRPVGRSSAVAGLAGTLVGVALLVGGAAFLGRSNAAGPEPLREEVAPARALPVADPAPPTSSASAAPIQNEQAPPQADAEDASAKGSDRRRTASVVKRPPVPPPARSAATSTAAPTTSAAPPPKPLAAKGDCDPPYTIDARGVQRIKPHCL